MKMLLAIFLLLTARLFAADGDVTLTIRPDGWTAVLSVEGAGYATGATYDFDWLTNNVPDTTTPYITIPAEMGFDATGTPDTKPRTVYLTSVVRFPSGTATTTGTWSAAGSFTSGTFADGETITQTTTGATGIIVGDQSAGTKLHAKILSGSPDDNNIWTGGTSAATFTPTAVPVVIAEGTKDEKDTGTALEALVSLSEYVYQKSEDNGALLLTCKAGFVVSGMNSSNARSAAAVVTNGSTQAYQDVVASWTRVPYQSVTGSTFTVGVTAWHGQVYTNGKPGIACVKITATDGTGPLTETVTLPSIDSTMPDRVKVQEYLGTFSTTTLDALANITVDFIAYPEIGDADACHDTSTTTLLPAACYGTGTLWNDKSDTYGITIATVDSAAADDTSGVVVNLASHGGDRATAEAACTPWKTIGKAADAIEAFNNSNHSRGDVGGGEVAVVSGSSLTFTGSANTYGTTPETWIKIRPATGAALGSYSITGTAGNTDISDRVWIYGANITASVTNVFTSLSQLWLDRCILNSTANTPININLAGSALYVTHCHITDWSQGLRPFSTNNNSTALIRGNLFSGFNDTVLCYTVIGNLQLDRISSGSRFVDRISGGAAPAGTAILAFNRIMAFDGISSAQNFNFGAVDVDLSGQVVACNVFECSNPGSVGLGSIGSSTITDGRSTDNIIVWNNVFVGGRMQFGYNDSGTVVLHRRHWSVKNNYWDISGMKGDDFGTHNGKRIGGWPVLWGVNFSGNMVGNVNAIASPGFDAEFTGISSQDDGINHVASYPAFVDRRSYDGAARQGNGTYRVRSSSPLVALPTQWMLPYDLDGIPVTSLMPTGPYTLRGSAVTGAGSTVISGAGSAKIQ